MNGLTIFLLGTVALSNVGLLVFLLKDRKNPASNSTPSGKKIEESPVSEAENNDDSCIGKSRFNPEEFQTKFDLMFKKVEEIEKQTYQLRDKMLGDVDESDVEFGETEEKSPEAEKQEYPTPATADTESQAKTARMNKDEESKAFEDVRIDDVDPDTVSPPSATGASIDEIEDSVNTFGNMEAPAEMRVKAAKLLERLDGTNLMELLSHRSPKIMDDIRKCVQQDVRERMTGRRSVPSTPSNKRKRIVPDNIEDFDPADWLPK